MASNKISIRLELNKNEPLAKKLKEIREELGLKNYSEVIRFLIKNWRGN